MKLLPQEDGPWEVIRLGRHHLPARRTPSGHVADGFEGWEDPGICQGECDRRNAAELAKLMPAAKRLEEDLVAARRAIAARREALSGQADLFGF